MSQQQFERFGKYVLMEKLATGGMAEVFLARSTGTSGIAKFFAIKRILPQYAESPEFIEMFKEEAKIAINLSHSNIVSIHEFGVQKYQFFLVMDYVEGRNLRQILNKMKKSALQFSIDQIAFVIKEVAAGLDHAHRCLDSNTGKPLNITHRDMSPQNIMVSFEGEVKIVDFGIAKAESQIENTRAGTLKGKFGYMSPEQAEGQPIDLRTDIFSLGIVLWELLAGDRLFSANNELNTLRKIRDCQIPSLRKINPNIHSELERIAQKALARDRNLRYQTAAAFHRDLNRFLNRQYPDFSPQDFSVFVKSIFSEDIMAIRKRLVDYTKITLGREDAVAHNEGTQTSSLVTQSTDPEPTGPQGLNMGSINSLAPEDRERLFLDSSISASKASISLDTPAGKTPDRSLFDQQHEELSSPSIQARTGTGISRNTHYTSRPRHYDAPSGPSVKLTTLALFTAVTLGIYSYLVKYHTAAMLPVIRMTQPVLGRLHDALGVSGSVDMANTAQGNSQSPVQAPVPIQPQPVVPAAKPPVTEASLAVEENVITYVVISSQPSGAEIYIDGRNTGMITPSRVTVSKTRPFQLVLKRTGYSNFMRSELMAQTIGLQFTAKLQESQIAFVDIDIIPMRHVSVSINGVRIGERPPFRALVIPANTPVSIRVEDTSGNFDETSVQLERNHRKHIVFNLRNRMAN